MPNYSSFDVAGQEEYDAGKNENRTLTESKAITENFFSVKNVIFIAFPIWRLNY